MLLFHCFLPTTFKDREIFNMSEKRSTEKAPPSESAVGTESFAVAQNIEVIEAPVSWKAYFICAFASVGGVFFGYDSSYINGINGSLVFIHAINGPDADVLSTSANSLIVSILSAGTFIGALMGGDLADWYGRRWTIIASCIIFSIGVVIQMLTGLGNGLVMITIGRLISGIGVGLESAVVILYMSEIVSLFTGTESQEADFYIIVPTQGSWRSCGVLSVRHHHWHPHRSSRRICYQ